MATQTEPNEPSSSPQGQQVTGQAARPPSPPPANDRARHLLALLIVVIISGLIIAFRERLAGLGAYGYPGLFLVNVFSSATVILPMPGLALAFAAGSSLNPFLVGLAMGSGAAVGELTGYLAGYGGQVAVAHNPTYLRIQGWMRRHGLWVVFALAAIPNPFFDVVGVISGIMRIPAHHFLVVVWCGNVIKATTVALVGAETISRLSPLLQQWLMK